MAQIVVPCHINEQKNNYGLILQKKLCKSKIILDCNQNTAQCGQIIVPMKPVVVGQTLILL